MFNFAKKPKRPKKPKSKRRWFAASVTVCALMVTAVGCGRIEIPALSPKRWFSGSVKLSDDSTAALRQKRQTASLNDDASIQGCAQLARAAAAPLHLVAEYRRLRELLPEMSPILHQNPGALDIAHADAFRLTNINVRNTLRACLRQEGLTDKDKQVSQMRVAAFESGVRRYRKSHPAPKSADDLAAFIAEIGMQEESALTNAYLDVFYSEFIHALDPFGAIVFGSNNTPSDETTIGRNLDAYMPEGMATVPVARRLDGKGGVLFVFMPNWAAGDPANTALAALERTETDLEVGSIVLDLRFTGGSEADVLRRFRDSIGRSNSWVHKLPLFVIAGPETYGTASVFLWELATQKLPNVHIYSPGSVGSMASVRTYGYGRRLVQKSEVLARDHEGRDLLPASVTIGSELLVPPGEANAEGYRLGIDSSHSLWVNQIVDMAQRAAINHDRSAVDAPSAQPSPIPPPEAPVMPLPPPPPPPPESAEATPPVVPMEARGEIIESPAAG
jgi:hypothetical protein